MKNLESSLGHVPHWIRSWSLGGAHTARLVDYLNALLDPAGPQSSLSLVERELLAVVTSTKTGCSYCRLNHVRTLAQGLGDKRTAWRIALDYRDVDELSDRERALADFAEALADDPHRIGDRDFDRLRQTGLTDEQIFEGMLIITAFSAANRLLAALNVTPDPDFFE